MRLRLPEHAERFGANLFHSVQKVYELDGGFEVNDEFTNPFHVVQQIPYKVLHGVESRMAIIIPIKNERLRLLEGLLYGIPHYCLPIIVSNSAREPVDRYRMEVSTVENYCRYAKKEFIIMHQRSPELAQLFRAGGYEHLLDETGLVRNGKAEGMLAGILLARLSGRQFVGFIDSDNFFPGSVFEYVRLFSAGLSQAKSPYSMVRILWNSKPKIVGSELFFAKWGRVSRITNIYLNQFLSQYTGFETDVLRTGNAGEHAMSMDLALLLDYSAGFSVETYHFVNLLERFGGVTPGPYPEVMKAGVEVFQMESRNPHLHEADKGDDHIQEMIEYSLGVLYHSPLCLPVLKQEILTELQKQGILSGNAEPLRPRQYPAMIDIDFEAALKVMDWQLHGNFIPAV